MINCSRHHSAGFSLDVCDLDIVLRLHSRAWTGHSTEVWCMAMMTLHHPAGDVG